MTSNYWGAREVQDGKGREDGKGVMDGEIVVGQEMGRKDCWDGNQSQ